MNTVDSWRTTLTDLVRYSGAVQDFNTIHHDEEAASCVGFDGVVAHGMFTLGRVLTGLAERRGLRVLVACQARFLAPVHVGAPVTVTECDRADGVQLTVHCGEVPALVVEVNLGEPPHAATFAEPAGDPVADHQLRVERAPLTQLARAVGGCSAIWYDARTAKHSDLPGVPAVPTAGFVLPAFGWYPDDQMSADSLSRRPDPVADSALWAGSEGPVVHAGQAFTYRRPLTAGELVRSRQWITGRYTKPGTRGELRFTEVTQLLTDKRGETVLAATSTLLASSGEGRGR